MKVRKGEIKDIFEVLQLEYRIYPAKVACYRKLRKRYSSTKQ